MCVAYRFVAIRTTPEKIKRVNAEPSLQSMLESLVASNIDLDLVYIQWQKKKARSLFACCIACRGSPKHILIKINS